MGTESEANLTKSSSSIANDAPKDKYNFIYMSFLAMGCATLLPWNFFISESGYWNYRFRNVTIPYDPNGPSTDIQTEFFSYLAIASNIPNALTMILNAIFGQKVALKKRLIISLVGVILLFAVVSTMAKINSDNWQSTFLGVTLALVAVINIYSATYQSGVMGVAGKFPYRFMGAIMIGQAIGGVTPPIINIIILSFNVDQKDIGFWCFLLATIFLLFTLVLIIFCQKAEYFMYYAEDRAAEGKGAKAGNGDGTGGAKEVIVQMLRGAKHSWQYCLSAFLVFTVSLSVFPAMTVNVGSQFKGTTKYHQWSSKYFVLVCNFLLFNAGDLFGRFLAGLSNRLFEGRWGRWVCLTLAIVRVIFIPLFLMCNALPSPDRALPITFDKDGEFIAIMCIFAVSNGYLGTISMIHGPKTVEDSKSQEGVAMMLAACLVIGIAAGSSLSYPVLNIIQ